jgi:hypothetical protein
LFVGRPDWQPSEAAPLWSKRLATLGRRVRDDGSGGSRHPAYKLASALRLQAAMLKLLGSIALARLLGFGIIGFLVIYLLLSLLG